MKKNPTPSVPATPVQTPLLAAIRGAKSVEDALAIVQPGPNRPAADTTYTVNEVEQPLPQKRGLAVQVYVVAARLNAPFKSADIETALPGKKSVRYWVRRLAKDGHFVPATS